MVKIEQKNKINYLTQREDSYSVSDYNFRISSTVL